MVIWLHRTKAENDFWSLKVASAWQDARICFYWFFGMLIVWNKLIWEKEITKKRIYSNTYERNQNKDVIIIIINTRTKK